MSEFPALPPFEPVAALARELGLTAGQVAATLELLRGGATVPFLARYRKEATGGLDEVQIRDLDERHTYLRELHERKEAVWKAIDEQGKLTPALARDLARATTKAQVEDLFAPYRSRRRTRAVIARERGLAPLADWLLSQPMTGDPSDEARALLTDDVPDTDAALAGARDIVAETLSDRADIRAAVRARVLATAELEVEATPEARATRTAWEQYYDFRERLRTMPSHRFLAIRRGEKEGMLRTRLGIDHEALLDEVLGLLPLQARSVAAPALRAAAEDGLRRLLLPSVENDLRTQRRMEADLEAVEVFARNLRPLLLAAPLGEASVVGIDPGFRTGCKCAAVDATGRFLDTITIYPTVGGPRADRAADELLAFLAKWSPRAIAVGNGTGGRETESFVRQTLKRDPALQPIVVLVNEAGASVYSASDLAREEFPELDITVRGAISIARRLQDPLAELVKIDPKSIGVGQYQHDVHQPLLERRLGEVVESCVHAVGVELNTASAPLLARVAGIGESLAKKIVDTRNQQGPFADRHSLRRVPGLGPKTYEQCAGFLRLRHSAHPLDRSAVHPERYALVERMARDLDVPLSTLVGSEALASRIDLNRYVTGDVGLPTLQDIVAELSRPGRDPRESFAATAFREDVQTLEDVKPGMVLQGVVTNVAAFGAFVDIGVHQDGLVHISQLSETFVRNPSDVVSPGTRLTVKVLEVDLPRKRISLTARLGEEVPRRAEGGRSAAGDGQGAGPPPGRSGSRPKAPAAGDRARGRDGRTGSGAAPSDEGFKPFAALLQNRGKG
jgi:uncharacterized protein